MIIPGNENIEESVLLIGGLGAQSGNLVPRHHMLKEVFKYNGTWSSIGQLQKPRRSHSAIYWNGAVFVIGGTAKHNDHLKTEIWNISARVCDLTFIATWCNLSRWGYRSRDGLTRYDSGNALYSSFRYT